MIRLLTPDDFALWKAIRLEAVSEHPPAFGGSYQEESIRSDEEWAQGLVTSHIFVYLDGERPVGVAGYFFFDLNKLRHRAKIFTVYVNRDYRGRGIMDWLLGAIAYHARDQGIEQLHLDVGTYNASARRCYERNGFTVYGTEPRALKLGREYIDEYLMVKYL